ncbi:MAG: hypothetical protein JWM59_2961 [Verrucomicrobiales bacterium]|nr:hypothetical protein [Verrucomicrobiales bacterium]
MALIRPILHQSLRDAFGQNAGIRPAGVLNNPLLLVKSGCGDESNQEHQGQQQRPTSIHRAAWVL